MRNPDRFDRFYKDVRTRLLLLTYCLTGDLPASRAAVRDAFVVASHHWRKVEGLDDPEGWVRVRASGYAQRRHTAKLWHREKGLDPEVKATLDALGKLPVTQRRMLLLTELTTASLAEIAREVGLPRTEAERELQTATAQLSVLREVPTTSIRTLFEPVRLHLEDVHWPRATIIRRSGAARRRTHTAIGAAATVAALVLTGTLVTDASGVRPSLTGGRIEAHHPANPHRPSAAPTAEPPSLPEETLLGPDQVGRRVPGKGWRVVRTDDNTGGDGLVMPCQRSRYADPRTPAALVRTFASSGKRPARAMQAAHLSRKPRAAERSYRTALAWFAGCTEDRAQLISTRAVQGVGDEATLLVLRTWDGRGSTIVVGVARTGRLTTTLVSRSPVGKGPRLTGSASLLAAAVTGLCEQEAAGSCAQTPRLRDAAPIPVSTVPSMLAEVDLPPVRGVRRPWVGTEPRQARDNAAATGCDQTSFKAGPMANNITRTFLIPGAKLRDEFGLTETVGSMPEQQARAFVARVRDKLATCSKRQFGTQVERVRHLAAKHRDLTVWHVRTEISDDRMMHFFMGIVRDRNALAQIGFVPDPRVGMPTGSFVTLVERALSRLEAMPDPKAR